MTLFIRCCMTPFGIHDIMSVREREQALPAHRERRMAIMIDYVLGKGCVQ